MTLRERLLDYLRRNLTDTGTMRSLLGALAGIYLNQRATTNPEHLITIGMILLGLVSAAIPPPAKKP